MLPSLKTSKASKYVLNEQHIELEKEITYLKI